MNREEIFNECYERNLFQGKISKSGPGSDPDQTVILKSELIKLCHDLKIDTFVDFPCGDFSWMKDIIKDLDIHTYLGMDIVKRLIEDLKCSYEDFDSVPMIFFKQADIVTDVIPNADLLLCRDCLVHLSFDSAVKALRNMAKSHVKYFLMTTFTNDKWKNVDFEDGTNWYPINMTKSPFNLPMPGSWINEHCTECNGGYSDKSLGLWTNDELKKACGI